MECGRGADCQAASEVYHEIECDADELASIEAEMARAEGEGRHWAGSSYLTQEIVGIGGAVKKKIKKKVMVGAAVKEYEDERRSRSNTLICALIKAQLTPPPAHLDDMCRRECWNWTYG